MRLDRPTLEGWRANRYVWLALAFAGAYVPVAVAMARARGHVASLPLAAGLVICAIASAGGRTYLAWRAGGHNPTVRGWAFDVTDMVLISAGVRATGGLDSELWLIYFLLLTSESLWAGKREAWLLFGLSAVGYSLAAWSPASPYASAAVIVPRLFFLYVVAAFVRQLTVTREQRNRELAALREDVAAGEERARIAREVHDGLGHALVACILRLDLCARLVRRDPEQAAQILDDEVPALRSAWNQGRDLAFHLTPWSLGPGGLVEDVRTHAGRFAERTGVIVEVTGDLPADAVGADAALGLLRILQECLTNVARHASATKVVVQLAGEGPGRVACTVQDDGVGFDESSVSAGIGIGNMRARAERLGGALSVSSRPGSGTVVRVVMGSGG